MVEGGFPETHELHLNGMKAPLWFQRVLWVPLSGVYDITTLVDELLVSTYFMSVPLYERRKARRERILNKIWSQKLDWF